MLYLSIVLKNCHFHHKAYLSLSILSAKVLNYSKVTLELDHVGLIPKIMRHSELEWL